MDNIPRTHEGKLCVKIYQNVFYTLCLINNKNIIPYIDIEAQIREIQSKKKEVIVENPDKGVGLGESGYFDSEIYDSGGGKGKYEGYVTSIAANDEVDDEEYDVSSYSHNKRGSGYSAPAALLNDVVQVIKLSHIQLQGTNIIVFTQSTNDYDPFADRRRPTIAEKEDEYRQKRRRMIISPERVDPFAEGLFIFFPMFGNAYLYKFFECSFVYNRQHCFSKCFIFNNCLFILT